MRVTAPRTMNANNMLKSLFKPKWRHADPQVRMQALQALDASRPESRAVLHEAATGDSDALVRRVAIKGLNDLDVLWRIVQNETDTDTRSAAQQRFMTLLAGTDPETPPLAARLRQLADLTDQKLIDDLARRGVEVELRRAALQRVEREALLGDIALNDADAGLRLAAVERITQKSTLERVAKLSRTKDKRVSGLVRDKLEKLTEAAERPARLRQRARNACIALEALAHSKDIGESTARVHALETEWSTVLDAWDVAQDGALDAELTQRYADVRAALELVFEKHAQVLTQQREHAAQQETVRAHKTALCERLETIAADLEQDTTPDSDDKADVADALRSVQDDWRASGDLPDAAHHEIRTRYDAGVARIEACIADRSRHAAAQAACTDLLARAEALLAADAPPREADIKSLEKALGAIERPRHYVLDDTLTQGVADAVAKLHARHAQHAQKVHDDVDKLKRLVSDIEQAVADGQSKQAAELQRTAQQLFEALPPHAAATLRKQGVVGRWQAAEKTIRDMWSWKKWAGAPVKERLVEDMEALARSLSEPGEVAHDYRAIAQQITQAREQWKSLGATDNSAAKDLWERFNTACDAAHAPCAAFFKAERAQRAEHARLKQDICSKIEQFIAQTDWTQADWKTVERMLRVAREEWSRIGPTERAQGKTLGKRFNALMDDLAARLGAERSSNKARKESLIKRMEQLADTIQDAAADSAAVPDAITQAKQLQSQWRSLGASTESATLWNAFRAAGDRIFARRQALHEAKDQERQANLESKRALCEQIEALARLEGDAFAQARARLQQAKAEFDSTGPVPKQDIDAIQQRFREACRAVEQQDRALQTQAREQSLLLLQRKVQLCADLDKTIAAVLENSLAQDAAETRLRGAREAWQALASTDADIGKRLEARFQNTAETLQGLLGSDRESFVASYTGQLQENLAAKEQLCLRAEIAAEIDSPPDYRQQRMQYQVELLARRMRDGDSVTDAERIDVQSLVLEWNCIGAVPAPTADALQTRYDCVRHALEQLAH